MARLVDISALAQVSVLLEANAGRSSAAAAIAVVQARYSPLTVAAVLAVVVQALVQAQEHEQRLRRDAVPAAAVAAAVPSVPVAAVLRA